MKKLLYITGSIIGIFFSLKLWNKLQNGLHVFYTAWLSRNFLKLGKGTIIMPKVTLKQPNLIEIGDYCKIGQNSTITAWGKSESKAKIIISDGCNLGDNIHITAINQIVIGRNVLAGKWVTITDNSHGRNTYEELDKVPDSRTIYSKGPVIIGNNVWIGEKVTICPDVVIGNNCIVGANSVVSHSVADNCVLVGSPAKVIKVLSKG